MLNADEITFLTRMGERLLGVAIGGMSVFLGYRLFAKVPLKTDSAGKLLLPGGTRIVLSRVGPGVFFSLFGAAIVLTAFTRGVELTSRVAVTSTDPSGATRVSEETRERRGVGATTAVPASEMERRLVEARTQIYTLNRDLPRALRKDVHADDRKLLELARDYSKAQILRAVWRPQWGPVSDFEAWVRDGARAPAPASISEPARLYLDGLEPAAGRP